MTVEHIPPRGMFDFHSRPDDLVFPACNICNEQSKDCDQILSLVTRMYPDPADPKLEKERERKIRSFVSNYPGAANGLVLKGTRDDGSHVVSFGGLLTRSLQQWGVKFALAMHYLAKDQVASSKSSISVDFFTDYNFATGTAPLEHLISVFRNRRVLQQGKFTSKGQFVYDYIGAEDADMSVSFCLIRRSALFITSVTSEESRKRADSGRVTFVPADVRLKYPYGWLT